MGLLLEGIAAAASVGLGCGTCCGTTIHAALYGFLMTHVKDMGETLRAYARFLAGKVMAVVLLTTLASLLGKSLLDENGRAFGLPLSRLVDLFLILLGVYLLLRWVREAKGRKKASCLSCKGCTPHEASPASYGALLGMGFGYGLSPCAPLLLICSYGAVLPVGHAALLGATFALASTLFPGLLFLAASGALATKMQREIGEQLSWLRLSSYILLIFLSLINICKEVVL